VNTEVLSQILESGILYFKFWSKGHANRRRRCGCLVGVLVLPAVYLRALSCPPAEQLALRALASGMLLRRT
jgi:hypothetical protein